MKKFYTMLGLLAVAGVATAANVANVPAVQQSAAKVNSDAKLVSVDKMLKAPAAKVAGADDMVGNYLWLGYGGLTSSVGYEQGDLQIVKEADGTYVAYGINSVSDVKIPITIDAAAGTLSLPSRVLVAKNLTVKEDGTKGDVYFEHSRWNATGDGIDRIDTPMMFDIAEDGSGFVAQNDEDLIAVTVYVGSERLGWFKLYYFNEFVSRPNKLSNEGWEDYGTATLENPWFAGCPDFEGVSDSYKVKMQRSTEDKGIIRLLNPYGEGTPFAKYNISAAEGSIIIDINEPDCVIVHGTYNQVLGQDSQGNDVNCVMGSWAGFMMTDQAYYPLNYADTYVVLGFTAEDILGEFSADQLAVYDAETNQISVVDAVFTNSFTVSKGVDGVFGGWTAPGQVGVPVITLDPNNNAVESVEFDSNAPVKFYNLQGLEVAEPVKGQIVIKKQGSKVQKIVAE